MQTHLKALSPVPSRADQELISGAAVAGVLVSSRQLKRWRLAGLVPSPTRQGLGRGKGSISFYPPGTLERVVALTQLPRRWRTSGPATLCLFALGFTVEEAALRRAHSQWAATVEIHMRRAARSSDPFDMAEAAALRMLGPFVRTPFGRQCLKRLRHRGESSRALLLSALTALMSILLTGSPSSPEAFAEYLDAIGASKVLARFGVPREQAVQDFFGDEQALTALGAISLRGLTATFAGASLADLNRARDDLSRMLRWLAGPGLQALKESTASPLVEGLDQEALSGLGQDLVDCAAIGVPMVLTVHRLLGTQMDDFRAFVRRRIAAASGEAA